MKKLLFPLFLFLILAACSEEQDPSLSREEKFKIDIESTLKKYGFKEATTMLTQKPQSLSTTSIKLRGDINQLASSEKFELQNENSNSNMQTKEAPIEETSEFRRDTETYITGFCTYTQIDYWYYQGCIYQVCIVEANWCKGKVVSHKIFQVDDTFVRD